MSIDQIQGFEHQFSTRLVYGRGQLSRLTALVVELGGSGARVFLVTGRHSLKANGAFDRINELLASYPVVTFDEVQSSPSPEVAERALARCRGGGCSIVVGVGGGSCLDVGKITALISPNKGQPGDYLQDDPPVTAAGLPLIAVPTTSGSSSEVTPFTVVWDAEAKKRYPFVHPLLAPAVALVDPDLAQSMSGYLAAVTGMDALTSACEAYWSIGSQPVSDTLALRAIRLYMENLEASCTEGNPQARDSCALACALSGMAYSSARTTGCHAFGTPLGLHYGMAHGAAVGITLPAFFRRNAPTLGGRLSPLLDAIGGGTIEEAADRLTSTMQFCGVATRLSQIGVRDTDLEMIARDALSQPQMHYNPKAMTQREGVALLREVL